MAARELLKLWASPPTVSPSARSSSARGTPPRDSASRRPKSRAQLRSVNTDRSSSTLVRAIWRAISWISSWSAYSRVVGDDASSASRWIHLPTFWRTRPIITSRMLQVHELGNSLAMERRIPEGELRSLRALEIEMEVVLPGEADPAVKLDAVGGDAPVGVRDVRLGHADRQRRFGHAFVHRPGGIVGDGLAVLDVHQHVRRLVLDALVRADRAAEGLTDLRVLDGHIQDLLGSAAHLGTERHRRAVEDAGDRRPAAADLAEPGSRCEADLFQRHLAELARLVHRGQQRDGQPLRALGNEEEGDPVGAGPARARRDDNGIGRVPVGDEELAAGEDVAPALLGGSERDAVGAELRAGLHPRERHPRLSAGDLRQPFLLLRVAAGLENDPAAQQDGGEVRPGPDGAAHLLHQDDQVDQAQA